MWKPGNASGCLTRTGPALVIILASIVATACLQRRQQERAEPNTQAQTAEQAQRAAAGEFRAIREKNWSIIRRCTSKGKPTKAAVHLVIGADVTVGPDGHVDAVTVKRSDGKPVPEDIILCIRTGLSKYSFEESLNKNKTHWFSIRFY